MTSDISIGSVVRHPKYGEGTIQQIDALQNRVWIHFKLLNNSKLIPLGEIADSIQKGSVINSNQSSFAKMPVTIRTGESVNGKKRLALECLRQGLPPFGRICEWTVGFKEVQQEIRKVLEATIQENRGKVLIIEAGYGAGKTHLGQIAMELSLSMGMLQMHIEFDGKALIPSDGVRLLSHLFSTAKLNSSLCDSLDISGLGTLLKLANRKMREKRVRLPLSLSCFRPFFEMEEDWVENEEAVEIIERYLGGELNRSDSFAKLTSVLGRHVELPPLKMAYGTIADRIAAQKEQLNRIVQLAKIAGAKGAFLLMDEFDHVFHRNYQNKIVLDDRACMVLESMCKLTEKCPLVMLWLTVSNDTMGFPNSRLLRLPELTIRELEDLTLNTIQAYKEAFPDLSVQGNYKRFTNRLYRKFKEEYSDIGWGPRFFVRAAIEACDRAIHTHKNLDEVLDVDG